VYPKVSGLAVWRENCKWYSSLPLGGVWKMAKNAFGKYPYSMKFNCLLFLIILGEKKEKMSSVRTQDSNGGVTPLRGLQYNIRMNAPSGLPTLSHILSTAMLPLHKQKVAKQSY
jgi:hypothetical protein